MKELRKRFFKKYRSLSKDQRQELMYMDGQPYTWNPIWLEVKNSTKLGDKFLKYLRVAGKI